MFIPWHRKIYIAQSHRPPEGRGFWWASRIRACTQNRPKSGSLPSIAEVRCAAQKKASQKTFFEGIALTSIFTGCGLRLACRHAERVDGSRLPICGRLGSRDIGTPEPISVCPALYQSTCENQALVPLVSATMSRGTWMQVPPSSFMHRHSSPKLLHRRHACLCSGYLALFSSRLATKL